MQISWRLTISSKSQGARKSVHEWCISKIQTQLFHARLLADEFCGLQVRQLPSNRHFSGQSLLTVSFQPQHRAQKVAPFISVEDFRRIEYAWWTVQDRNLAFETAFVLIGCSNYCLGESVLIPPQVLLFYDDWLGSAVGSRRHKLKSICRKRFVNSKRPQRCTVRRSQYPDILANFKGKLEPGSRVVH